MPNNGQDEVPKLISLFQGALIGYGIATICAIVYSWAQTPGPKQYNNMAAFNLLTFAGAGGAILGADITAKVRRSKNPSLAPDEFKAFIGSFRLGVLGVIVLVGALAFSTIVALLHDAVVQ
jgi:hypothetical protein